MAHVKTGEPIMKSRFQDQGLPSLGRYVHVPHSHGHSQSGKGSSRPLGPALAQEPHQWTGASFAPVEFLCLHHVVCISAKNNSDQSEKMNAWEKIWELLRSYFPFENFLVCIDDVDTKIQFQNPVSFLQKQNFKPS